MNTSKIMYIMIGMPGSGKSTLAQNMVYATSFNQRKGVIIGADDYFMVGPHYCFDNTKLGAAHAWTQWRANELCSRMVDVVIIDNTNLTKKERAPYIGIAKLNSYDVKFLEPGTSWAWDIKECFRLNRHNVPLDTLEKMKNRYQPPTEDELK